MGGVSGASVPLSAEEGSVNLPRGSQRGIPPLLEGGWRCQEGAAGGGSDFLGGFFDGRYEFELAGWAFDFSTGDSEVCS